MNFTVFMPMRTNRMKYVGIVLALLLGTFSGRAADSTGRKLVYTFPIREDIMPSVERLTGKCLAQADEMGADLVVIQMNTYGGVVAAADSIRTMLLNSRIPVWVWIDNQAASAGRVDRAWRPIAFTFVRAAISAPRRWSISRGGRCRTSTRVSCARQCGRRPKPTARSWSG